MSTTERKPARSPQRDYLCRDIAETRATAPLPMTAGDRAQQIEAWIWRGVAIAAACLPLWMVIRVLQAVIEGRFP